ncbi:MAG: hypothetical protein HFF87_11705 [Oscillibacter sp.]|jgi:hypothetical protein|nr:hypothetical protein [Oscillibacter sp.]MCI9482394.1 hypothetical protein [Oscillibacter sp.]
MAFRNLMLTTSGMILYAKAQQGKRLHLSRVAVGDGLLAGGDSMVNRSGLKSERASFLIDYVHIAASNSAAEILTTMRNDDLEDGFYFRELGIFAVDPDSGEELLYLYDNAGQDGEYIPAASENIKVIERLKMIVRLENTPDVTFTASGNPLYLTVDDIDDNAQSLGSLWSSLKISQMIEGMQNSLTGEPGQFVGFDENGKPEAQPLPESGVGRSLEGKTVRPSSDTTTAAGEGAEIFNDYREREYDSNEEPTQGNIASGEYSHAEGDRTSATAGWAHAEGWKTVAFGLVAHAKGGKTEAIGPYSHAEGYGTTTNGHYSHAEGSGTIASHTGSHAEGTGTIASGIAAHAEGNDTIASGQRAHAEGNSTEAKGRESHASGVNTIANDYQTVVGAFNVEKSGSTSSGSRFIVGGGWGARKNAFRVECSGACYGAGAWNSSGADYAELFEWMDGNLKKEDRVGRFVTLDGKYIRLATFSDDYILGIVSGNPSVVGDVYDDQWAGMFVLDVYGRPVYEWKDFPAETMEVPDENGGMETVEIQPAHREWVQKLNPDYDPAQTYIPRTERPEWAAVGLLGKLVVLDDGTCRPNGWAAVGEGGIATASKERTKFRVMERLDEDHIRVMIL